MKRDFINTSVSRLSNLLIMTTQEKQTIQVSAVIIATLNVMIFVYCYYSRRHLYFSFHSVAYGNWSYNHTSHLYKTVQSGGRRKWLARWLSRNLCTECHTMSVRLLWLVSNPDNSIFMEFMSGCPFLYL